MKNDRREPETLTRREAIRRVSALLGGMALTGQAAMLAGCAERGEPPAPAADFPLFPGRDVELLAEIAETILPRTDTPGAKDAGVGPFMALMVSDCYWPDEQAVFTAGLDDLDARSLAQHGAAFLDASPADRLALLEALDAEQHAYMQSREPDAPPHYFRMMKELALLGLFTSEVGYRELLRYEETPGRYDPCAPLEPGTPAWAAHA